MNFLSVIEDQNTSVKATIFEYIGDQLLKVKKKNQRKLAVNSKKKMYLDSRILNKESVRTRPNKELGL